MLTQKGIKTFFSIAFIFLTTIFIGYSDEQEISEEPVERPTPFVECVKTSQPPVIDGKLIDASWRYSGKIEKFIWANGIDEPYAQTEAFLLWDDDNFYLAIKCYEQQMDKIKVSRTRRDSKIREDDVVEIFIDPAPEIPEYYHLVVNPIGTLFDHETSQEPRKDIEWDSDTQVATFITSDFWTVEMAIPLFDLGPRPEVGDEWKFNLHRKEQRREEYTYWSPTYEKNFSWPHVPERFGTLRLSAQPPEQQTGEVSEGTPKISNITVKGNEVVPAEKIVDILGLKIDEPFDMDEVTRATESLEFTGWFKSINVDTVEDKDGVEIIIEVVEKELIFVDNVQIIGAKRPEYIPFFTQDRLVDCFGFHPGIMAVEDIDLKCRLIEQLYKHKKRTAFVSRDFEEDDAKPSKNTLVIKIDVEKKKERPAPIPGKPKLIQHFSFTFDTGTSDAAFFDRVRGLILGLGFDAKSTHDLGGGRIYGGFSYGFRSQKGNEWNYQFGLEPWLFNRHKLTAGIDVHKITQIRDETLFPNDEENLFTAIYFGKNYRDYYQREGYELSLTQIVTPSTKLVLKFRDDDYSSLRKRSNWSLFRRSKIKRKNLPVDDGRMRSIILSYEFDSRNEKETTKRYFHKIPIPSGKTTNGWKGSVSVEYAKSPLNADLNEKFDFSLLRVEVTRYNRLSKHQFFDIHLKGAIADNSLPLQYKFYLGGIGSLRGYKFLEFEGDKMILANLEYKIKGKFGIMPVIFVDSGYVWEHNDTPELEDLKTDIGIGFQIGDNIRINLAKPTEKDSDLMLTLRLKRAF